MWPGMGSEKLHIEKNTVQETLVMPLYGRKVCSERFPQIFHDEEADRLQVLVPEAVSGRSRPRYSTCADSACATGGDDWRRNNGQALARDALGGDKIPGFH